tara:strand:+ start:870 stop:1802 length:933 start_codon:yes stop_codon:yes gene_type:complete
MIKIKKIIIFIAINIIISTSLGAEMQDKILAKIGNEIITNYDIINEINTILALSNEKSKPENLKSLQSMAFQSLKKISIKKIELERYKVDDFNKKDLDSYLKSIANNIGIENLDLKDHFKKYGANYDYFVNKTIINLKWNSLIYTLYKKQLDVDEELIKSELNQEVKKNKEIVEFNLSEIVLENYNEKKISLIFKNINENGFENTAAIYSNSVSSTNKGLIGWIASKSISNDYLQEINKLKIGQISSPIKNRNNLVIIKLNDKRILNENNLDLARIEQNIINKEKEEKLNIFSNSHYVNLEKNTFIVINE